MWDFNHPTGWRPKPTPAGETRTLDPRAFDCRFWMETNHCGKSNGRRTPRLARGQSTTLLKKTTGVPTYTMKSEREKGGRKSSEHRGEWKREKNRERRKPMRPPVRIMSLSPRARPARSCLRTAQPDDSNSIWFNWADFGGHLHQFSSFFLM